MVSELRVCVFAEDVVLLVPLNNNPVHIGAIFS